ncbi:hypothetical protein [Deinococcus sp. Arct2-2]|uniref:hypothetical protein n=1 Tax=Deinococcus sp. Arct2-2 TaxID=2568653 RepID=UPI001454CC9C|nr:hypothetical protein [Deinococcus sp. Arct2-2]
MTLITTVHSYAGGVAKSATARDLSTALALLGWAGPNVWTTSSRDSAQVQGTGCEAE